MKVQVFNSSKNPLPKYETSQSAGLDIRADFSKNDLNNPIKLFGDGQFIPANEVQKASCLYLEPGSRALIPTGLYTAIPEGYELQLRPRSGLALKEGISMVNCVGTIDADYRNEIGVILINHSNKVVCIEDGERICQGILNKVETIDWDEVSSVKELGETSRTGGYGSTGTK